MENITLQFRKVMIALIALFFLLFAINPHGWQLSVFFAKTGNLLADYFNVMRYIADNDPYFCEINGPGEHCYLPLAYLMLRPFCLFFDFSSASLPDCYHSIPAMLSCLFFTVISLAMFVHSAKLFIGKNNKWILPILMLSSIFLFSIERGNLMLVVISLIFYFLRFKDSEDSRLRYFAIVCLCVASTLKVYPCILGIYLLRNRQFKDIAICIVLTLSLVFIPFVCFEHGFQNLPRLFENLSTFSESYSSDKLFPRFGIASTAFPFMKLLKFDDYVVNTIFSFANIITWLLTITSLGLFLKCKSCWKSLALVVFPLIMVPTNSAFYCGLYLFPVIILFLNKEIMEKRDMLYMILFCIMISPIQVVAKGMPVMYLVANICLVIMWLSIIITETKIIINSRSHE